MVRRCSNRVACKTKDQYYLVPYYEYVSCTHIRGVVMCLMFTVIFLCAFVDSQTRARLASESHSRETYVC